MAKAADVKPLQQPDKRVKTPKTKLARRKPSKKTVLIVLWLVLLLVVGLISFTVSRNNTLAAERFAEKSLVALKNNDDTTVYNLGSESFKKASDKQKVKVVVNQWSKIVNEATEGKPERVSKSESTEDKKQLTNLLYRYKVKQGKSKINQKDLYVKVVLDHTNGQYKLHTFSFDTILLRRNK